MLVYLEEEEEGKGVMRVHVGMVGELSFRSPLLMRVFSLLLC